MRCVQDDTTREQRLGENRLPGEKRTFTERWEGRGDGEEVAEHPNGLRKLLIYLEANLKYPNFPISSFLSVMLEFKQGQGYLTINLALMCVLKCHLSGRKTSNSRRAPHGVKLHLSLPVRGNHSSYTLAGAAQTADPWAFLLSSHQHCGRPAWIYCVPWGWPPSGCGSGEMDGRSYLIFTSLQGGHSCVPCHR